MNRQEVGREVYVAGVLPAWHSIRLRGVDLNHRPQGYEPCELPGCSTPLRVPDGCPEVSLTRRSPRRHLASVVQAGIQTGAGSGNRTHASALATPCSTFELYPHNRLKYIDLKG